MACLGYRSVFRCFRASEHRLGCCAEWLVEGDEEGGAGMDRGEEVKTGSASKGRARGGMAGRRAGLG